MKKDRKEMLKDLVKLLNKHMEEKSNEPDQYIVGYYRVDNQELIGYHLNTANQLTKNMLEAKRYHGDNPYSQMQIISDNLKYTMRCTKESAGFMSIGYKVKEQFFKGFKHSEIYLKSVYLEDGTPARQIKYILKENDQ